MLLATLLITVLAFAIVWAAHLPLKNAGVVDFYWGPGFVVIGTAYLLSAEQILGWQWLFFALVLLWAARLTLYLAARFFKHPSEDERYAVMRRTGGKDFWWRSLFKIFLLQAVILWAIASPVHAMFGTALVSNEIMSGPAIIGLVLFGIGFVLESVADAQLASFKSVNAHSNDLLASGLWKYSRHPNYFGEALIWWGFGLIAFGSTGSITSFIGPIMLTAVLFFVTGMLTDKHMTASRGARFEEYRRKTSPLVPMSPAFYRRYFGSSETRDHSPA